MLQNTFFTILKQTSAPGTVNASLLINKEHDILKGHFPGHPVVPGACMLQMVRELTELHLKRNLMIKESENMKFLAVIDPRENQEIEVNLSYVEKQGSVVISASLFSGNITFFKLKAILVNAA